MVIIVRSILTAVTAAASKCHYCVLPTYRHRIVNILTGMIHLGTAGAAVSRIVFDSDMQIYVYNRHRISNDVRNFLHSPIHVTFRVCVETVLTMNGTRYATTVVTFKI